MISRISNYFPTNQIFSYIDNYSKKNIVCTIVAVALLALCTYKIGYPAVRNLFNPRHQIMTDQPHNPIHNTFSNLIGISNDNAVPLRLNEINPISFEELVANTAAFEKHTVIPTQQNRIEYLVDQGIADQATIVRHANSVRPIIHHKTMLLIEAFLDQKRSTGNRVEKELYRGMDKTAFIDRLLTKRPLAFLTSSDSYLLKNQIRGNGGFEGIGKEHELPPLCLQNYLSYDEMAISALIGVSCPTYFINEGDRNNQGIFSHAGHQEMGIYVGLVGARFEKQNLMDWQHMIITPVQNTLDNGYGTNSNPFLNIWSNFYGHPFPTYEEALSGDPARVLLVGHETYLNIPVYKERLRRVVEPFLEEANQRAGAEGKKAYVHAVGIGLGVWQISPKQKEYMLEVYAEILNSRPLPHIADIDFSYFNAMQCGGVGDLEKICTTENEITVHFSNRNPAEKLSSDQKLLVASYAWDGNTFPGNEYWMGSLSASGDPAAACCSTIPQLQNPLINTTLTAKKLCVVS
ncbi:MAG: DUF4804 domain-containing protein [Candidatus Protochlamydia sp.]|nr:DUF4804 domain-containing protein [Candidatus Protochlamydia sp.]